MGVSLLGTIEGITTRKDKTIKITIGTQELPPVQAVELFKMQNSLGCIYISESEIQQDMMDEIDKTSYSIDSTGKSPSKRMRNVFFRIWEQEPEEYEDFELFYRFKMDQIIEKLKCKLV